MFLYINELVGPAKIGRLRPTTYAKQQALKLRIMLWTVKAGKAGWGVVKLHRAATKDEMDKLGAVLRNAGVTYLLSVKARLDLSD